MTDPQQTSRSTHPESTSPGLPASGLFLLAALTIIWGVNWPVMKIAMGEISVWWFRSFCLVFGAIGLLSIAAATGSRLIMSRHEIGPMLLTAAFAVLGWHVFSGFGVTMLPAGRAVIIAFTMPVWTAIAASLILGERLFTPTKIIGLALGLIGLAILIGPDLVAIEAAPIGALLMLASAMCWGLGTTLFKRFSWSIPVAANMGWQLLFAGIPVTIIALASSPFPDLPALSTEVYIATAYVILLPMTFGQWAYFQIVKLFPASIAAIGTMAIPVVGVYSSAILLDEVVGARELTALGFICAALAVILVVPNLTRTKGRAR